jgi:putative transposase
MTTLIQYEKENNDNIYFLTLKSVNGLPIILDKKYFDIILETIKYSILNKGWIVYAYTILINHIHIILKTKKDYILSKSIKEFKSFTGKKIIKKLELDKKFDILDELYVEANIKKDRKIQIWRRSVWPEIIASVEFLNQKVNYIDFNALKHGVVNDIELYPYTSYHNHYCNHDCFLKINDPKELI